MNCPNCENKQLTKGTKYWFCEDCGYKQPIVENKSLNADELFYKDAFDLYYPLLAHEYNVLYGFMKEKNYFGALLEYKDVVEIVLKFPTLIAINNLWRKENYELDEEKIIIGLLLGKLLTLGDWKAICGFFIKLYERKELKKDELADELMPLLSSVNKFYEKGSIVRWRNETIGHGALQTNLENDAKFIKEFSERLKALKGHLENNRFLYERLVVLDSSSRELRGKDCEERINDTLRIKLGNAEYEQEPFILVKDKTTSIFDSCVKDSVYVLNYITGSKEPYGLADKFAEKRKKFLSNEQLLKLSQSGSQLTNTAFDSAEIEILNKITDEKEAFTDPEYIIEDIIKFLDDFNNGILFLQMERGMGKTTLVRALDQLAMGNVRLDDGQNTIAIRAYYINNMFSYRINHFQNETENKLANAKNFDIERLTLSNIKTNFIDAQDMACEFARFLNEILDVYRRLTTAQKLLFIIDGLDEIRPPDEKEKRTIFDCIPHSEKLNEGVYIILTGRHKDETAKWINEKYAVIENKAVLSRIYSRSESHNTRTLENYLSKQIYAKKTSELEGEEARKVKTVIEKGDHRFLYVKALRELLKADNFDIDEISGENIMERYLKVLESRYGTGKHYEKMKRLLLIAAILNEPATIEELSYLYSFEPADFKFIGYLTDLKGLLHIDRTGKGETISASIGAMHDDWKRYLIDGNMEIVQGIIAGWINEIEEKVKNYQNENTEVLENISAGESYLVANIYSLVEACYKEAKSFFSDDDVRVYLSDFAVEISKDTTIISMERAKKIYTGLINDIETQNEEFDKEVLACLYTSRGECQCELQSLENAISDFSKSIEIYECLHNEGELLEENVLAMVYNDRGVTYVSMIEPDKAMADLDKCIEIWEQLRNNGELNDENILALAYNNYGFILYSKNEYSEAIKVFDKGIEISERLRDKNEYYEESILAMNYLNKGLTYITMTEYDKAIIENDKCVKIWERMLKEGKPFDMNNLAKAYLNKGLAYKSITEYEKGMIENDKCVEIWERMLEEGKLFDMNWLAKAYLNRGGAFLSTEKYDKAIAENNKCIKIWEKMQEEGNLFDKNNLAMAYLNSGYAYDSIKEYEKSIVEYNRCIEIYKRMIEEGKFFDINNLATAYLNKGMAYITNNENEKAMLENDRCIEICEQLQNEGKLPDKNNLAKAYLNKGFIYESIEEYEKSIKENEKCIIIFENLLKEGKFIDKNYLAIAYNNRGNVLNAITEYEKAIACYDKCLEIWEQLYREKRVINKYNFADVYYKRGKTYSTIMKYDKALEDYNIYINIIEKISKEEDFSIEDDLINVYFERGYNYYLMEEYNNSLEDYDSCLVLIEKLQEKDELLDKNFTAQIYLRRGLTFDSMEEYDKAIEDFDKCIGITESLRGNSELFNENNLAISYLIRADTYNLMEEYGKAIKDYDRGIEIYKRFKDAGELENEEFLNEAYENKKAVMDAMKAK